MNSKAYVIGFIFRFVLHNHPDSKGAYIVEYLFVVLSVCRRRMCIHFQILTLLSQPCAFIAAEYVLLGRLALDLNAAQHLRISPRKVTPFFVASDVTTFLIQVSAKRPSHESAYLSNVLS